MDAPIPSAPHASFALLLLAAAALIVLSMVFSAAESAFLAANKLRVRLLRDQKNRRAMRVWRLLSDKERLINTLLVGNNVVNITLSSILAYVAIRLFGNAGVGLATFCATLLLLIFGEITPKTIATRHPEAIALFFSGFVAAMEVLLSPLVLVFTAFSRLVLRACGVDAQKRSVSFTEEEIKTFIDVGGEQGIITENGQDMMHRVFSFTDLEAKDIMIPRKDIRAIPLGAGYDDVILLSQRFGVSRFPVYRRDIDDIVGILYVKDLLLFAGDPASFSVQKAMRPPLFILETKKMSGIQQMLRENHQGMAVVIDEYSGTDGVLTSEDIAREIFGPIEDEYRLHPHRMELPAQEGGEAEISGLSRLGDVNDHFGTHLASSACETIGGYLCEALGHIPAAGEGIVRGGWRFSVAAMDDKRVSAVRVQPEAGEAEE